MGNMLGEYHIPYLEKVTKLWSSPKAKKRKRSSSVEDTKYLKRIKVAASSTFMYEKYYKEGAYSDIAIEANDRIWNLHRVNLKQSPYFASMLSGAWKESNDKKIFIDIVDPNITVEALDIVFSSMYLDEVEMQLCGEQLPSILAAATLFQLDDLVEQCTIVMKQNLKATNVLRYYSVAEQYGVKHLQESAVMFLRCNLVKPLKLSLLSGITVSLMTEMVESPRLCVASNEKAVFNMLLTWVYNFINPIIDETLPLSKIVTEYFESRPGREFLLTEEGMQYQPAFRALRLRDMLQSHSSYRYVIGTNVIPKQWITDATHSIYLTLLRINDGKDFGAAFNCSEAVFDKNATRLARLIKTNKYEWTWPMMNYGMHLVFSFDGKFFEMTRPKPMENSYCLYNNHCRYVAYRVRVCNIQKSSSITESKMFRSGIKMSTIRVGEKVTLHQKPQLVRVPFVIELELLMDNPCFPSLECPLADAPIREILV